MIIMPAINGMSKRKSRSLMNWRLVLWRSANHVPAPESKKNSDIPHCGRKLRKYIPPETNPSMALILDTTPLACLVLLIGLYNISNILPL